jgi:predicted enzyme related to lactoylglutathione lyase
MDNMVDYFEVGTPDAEASKAFYGGLFSWSISEPSAIGYRTIDSNRGGIWDTTAIGGQHWGIFYVHVTDVKQSIARAEELGGKVLVPFTDNGKIEFAHLEDPHGNRFGVWHPKSSDA